MEMVFDHYSGMAGATLGFLFDIAEAWRSDRIALKTAQDVFSAVLQDFIPNIRLTYDRGRGPLWEMWEYLAEVLFREGREYHRPRPFIDSEQIIHLLRQCVSLDLGPQVRRLFNKLERLAVDEVEPAIIFCGLFLPLSKELNEMSADRNPGALAQEVHNMACLFTEKLPSLVASRCVGPKPPPPMDWRRQKCGCGCEECLQLDAFLDDPALETTYIRAISEDRLRHLENQMPLVGIDILDKYKEHLTWIQPTPSGFELRIYKRNKRWTFSVERWVRERDAATKIFNFFIDNEDMREDLEKALKNLGGEDVSDP